MTDAIITASALNKHFALKKDDIAFYHKRGYIKLRNTFSADTLEHYDEVIRGPRPVRRSRTAVQDPGRRDGAERPSRTPTGETAQNGRAVPLPARRRTTGLLMPNFGWR